MLNCSLIAPWPWKMKIYCSRQVCAAQTDRRTDTHCDFLSSCRSQKYFIYAKSNECWVLVVLIWATHSSPPPVDRVSPGRTRPRDTNRMRITIMRSVSARCLARKEVSYEFLRFLQNNSLYSLTKSITKTVDLVSETRPVRVLIALTCWENGA